jgi:hypothetical protein
MAKDIKPFVKIGERLGFVAPLKERGLYPPRLHNKQDPNNNDNKHVTTPYLVIPVASGDNGARTAIPNSLVFHSKGIWIENLAGSVITTPIVGGEYRIKCKIVNLGAFPAYGGLANFFINTPATFNAAAGTSAILPALGNTGFSLPQGREITITCPNSWKPTTPADVASSIVVHVYDPFTGDTVTSRFDARNDRHVGRHDFTSDFYVRDWTDSATVRDDGREPSIRSTFYRTSDVWNRRFNNPGTFVNDQPANQNPQAGSGAAGDNFAFARISRNDSATQETIKAHFLYAEFGTGSPFVDCSAVADPSVTFMPGETSKIISLPWHLPPSSSTHLCLAVQVYSVADPYFVPGLLGYTPGWPTTDMMVIADNNKAQRNISVWDGVPETEGFIMGLVFNAATFVRNVTLRLDASEITLFRLTNPQVSVVGMQEAIAFKPKDVLTLNNMLPGERRWVTFAYDKFTPEKGETGTVFFNELVGKRIVNGFAFDLRGVEEKQSLAVIFDAQKALFYRMNEGMGLKSAKEGLDLMQEIANIGFNPQLYMQIIPKLIQTMSLSLNEMSNAYNGLKDVLNISATLKQVQNYAKEGHLPKTMAAYNKLLRQIDAWQTMAIKSRGDEADILFTVRLQKEVFKTEKLVARTEKLLKSTDTFIVGYSRGKVTAKNYPAFLKNALKTLNEVVGAFNNPVLSARYEDLMKSMSFTPAPMQKAHLAFLNTLLILLQEK